MKQKKKKTKVYISAPISGCDLDERKGAFLRMEKILRERGYDVFNPLGEKNHVDGLSTHEYMRQDISALLTCDAIILLDGWNKSAGCKCELDVAVACGLDVWFEKTEAFDI